MAPTGTKLPPTPTEPPLAARVNGEGIWLSEYQAELQQFQAASTDLDRNYLGDEARSMVLNNLVAEVLLAQGADAAGYALSDEDVQAHINDLASQAGGESALQSWMSANGYTQETFFHHIKRNVAATWQRDQILASVPVVAEQVHARQILVLDENVAISILAQIKAGVSFENYAYQHDPLTGGDLGWFPRGYLTQVSVEEAVFSLQAGEVSDIIHTEFGYHILKIVERDPELTLSADARQALQRLALQSWLDQRKTASTIEVLLP